ncbi:MAG: tetratricopeptide repeat protein [Acidobacteriota bacterium]|nr:tetratricopeptide repeat protein [Acidobacteriota bacterium]
MVSMSVVLLSVLVFQSQSLFDTATAPHASAVRELSPEQRGDILMAHKRFREAVDAYREGSESSAILHNKTGIAFHQMLQLPTAKKEYERAIRLSASYSEAVNNLGTVYYGQKSYRRAIRLYKQALKISPKSASIHSNLGTAYFARKDYKNATLCYQQAVELDPEVFEHHSSYGSLLQERSVTERAKFHYYMAKTYAKAGQQERALLYMRKALEEGFTERHKFAEDSEFDALRANPEFQQLIASEPRVL